MALKYPNKIKRVGYWKQYERAGSKDFLLVWNAVLSIINPKDIPFRFAERGRKPTLTEEECVAMAVMYAYFPAIDFRSLEYLVALLTGKHLDHSNCVRWFGRLTVAYVDALVFQVHQRILDVSDIGDYITDSSEVLCDRLQQREKAGNVILEHQTWKLHLLSMYLVKLGLMSITSIFPTPSRVHEGPVFRNHFLKKERVIPGRRCHGDKAFFGKENIKKCKEIGLKPNIVPKDIDYSDGYLKRYVRKEYDNQSRKQNRGLVEGIFGGLETNGSMQMRCRTPHHRDIYVALLGLAHNIRTYLRATALRLLLIFAPTPPPELFAPVGRSPSFRSPVI